MDVNRKNDWGETLFGRAAADGNLAMVEMMMTNARGQVDLNQPTRSGDYHEKVEMTPLKIAAHGGHEDVVRYLLQIGSPKNGSTDQRCPVSTAVDLEAGEGGFCGTVLWAAVYGNHLRVADLLLQHGADREARGRRGLGARARRWSVSPLWQAVHAGSVDMVELLISRGASVMIRGRAWYQATGEHVLPGQAEHTLMDGAIYLGLYEVAEALSERMCPMSGLYKNAQWRRPPASETLLASNIPLPT